MSEPSTKTLEAIGRLITRWATFEGYLSALVGMAVATEMDLEAWKPKLNPRIIASATSVAMGSSAKATLAQLEFLIPTRAAAIHRIAVKALDIKAKRDRIAHAASTAEDEAYAFNTWGASRVGGGKRYVYSASQINEWADRLEGLRHDLMKIVFEATGSDFDEVRKQVREWTEAHQAAAGQHAERLNRLKRDHEAKLEELEQRIRSLREEG